VIDVVGNFSESMVVPDSVVVADWCVASCNSTASTYNGLDQGYI
jgi:hypothetical protein